MNIGLVVRKVAQHRKLGHSLTLGPGVLKRQVGASAVQWCLAFPLQKKRVLGWSRKIEDTEAREKTNCIENPSGTTETISHLVGGPVRKLIQNM